MGRCNRCHVTRRNHYTLIKTQEQHNEYDREDEVLVVVIFHYPDLHDPSDGGREEEWAESQQWVESQQGHGVVEVTLLILVCDPL